MPNEWEQVSEQRRRQIGTICGNPTLKKKCRAPKIGTRRCVIRRYTLALAALRVRCDAERLRRPGRRRRIVDRRCWGGRLEYGFAAVAELRIFLDHAGRDAVDIRDELAA